MARPIKVVEKKLRRQRALGQTFVFNKVIEIDPRQCQKEYLDTLVHEALHIVFPDLSERKVASTSRKISSTLWKMGYRRITK